MWYEWIIQNYPEPNLLAENIKNWVEIFGILWTLTQTPPILSWNAPWNIIARSWIFPNSEQFFAVLSSSCYTYWIYTYIFYTTRSVGSWSNSKNYIYWLKLNNITNVITGIPWNWFMNNSTANAFWTTVWYIDWTTIHFNAAANSWRYVNFNLLTDTYWAQVIWWNTNWTLLTESFIKDWLTYTESIYRTWNSWYYYYDLSLAIS